MKKIIAMLMMMVLATFASPLFATNTSPPSFDTHKTINAGQKNVNVKSDAHYGVSQKIYIHQRDSLMSSWLWDKDSNKAMENSGSTTVKMQKIVAEVSQKRGVSLDG